MKQLVNGEEAEPCEKQPTAACSDCPWSRKALKGWLGSLSTDEWLEVAHGESSAACHALKSPDGDEWVCAGLAIYRANVAKSPRDPSALRLPSDREKVFGSRDEFRKHHEKEKNEEEPLDLSGMELWNADPDCDHDIKALWSGVKCTKCSGWYCL